MTYKIILRSVLIVALSCLVFQNVKSQEKEADKIAAAAKVIKDFTTMNESIPAELLKITEGIIVVPKLINAGFVVAGKRGKGIAMVKNSDGTWSDPTFVTITGGSIGFQVGVQSIDLVLVFKNRETLKNIGKGTFTLGGDISVTAGPVGRSSSATTDYKLEAEVYSYSRSKGIFAGISLSGSALDVDAKANKNFYGGEESAEDIFSNKDENENASIHEIKQTLGEMDDQ
jgi:lipid-binding SYLF domain-containing protein